MPQGSLASRRSQVDGLHEAIEFYYEKGWTDGFPVVPPTEGLVRAFLEAAGREPSDVLGIEPVRGRVITAEKAAVNAVMAGCRPEYFPAVATAVEAICEEHFNLHAITASTAGAAVMVVVNGPVAKELGMNSGINLFGPGNRANATIGRAIRLTVLNVIGAIPGELDKATLGHPGKYGYCIAEAEDVSPWPPLHVERGLAEDASAVTVFAAMGPWQVRNHVGNTPETVLISFVDLLQALGPSQGEIVVVLSPQHVGHIEAAGWSKSHVREYLCKKTQRPIKDWAAAIREYQFLSSNLGADIFSEDPEKLVSVCRNPDSITLIVGGGSAGGFSSVIGLWGKGINSRSVTKEIHSPDGQQP